MVFIFHQYIHIPKYQILLICDIFKKDLFLWTFCKKKWYIAGEAGGTNTTYTSHVRSAAYILLYRIYVKLEKKFANFVMKIHRIKYLLRYRYSLSNHYNSHDMIHLITFWCTCVEVLKMQFNSICSRNSFLWLLICMYWVPQK